MSVAVEFISSQLRYKQSQTKLSGNESYLGAREYSRTGMRQKQSTQGERGDAPALVPGHR